MTGAQILNMQAHLAHPTREGEYRWDFMDGLQGEEDNEHIPEALQEKFKRAIIEGHVADEDWRGVGYVTTSSYRKLTVFDRNLSSIWRVTTQKATILLLNKQGGRQSKRQLKV